MVGRRLTDVVAEAAPVVLLDEVDIISPDNDGPVHLGGLDGACAHPTALSRPRAGNNT